MTSSSFVSATPRGSISSSIGSTARHVSLLPSESAFTRNSLPASELLKRILSRTTCQPLRLVTRAETVFLIVVLKTSRITSNTKNIPLRICCFGIGINGIVYASTVYRKTNARYLPLRRFRRHRQDRSHRQLIPCGSRNSESMARTR
jgi:hypothetical protein